MEDGDQLGRRIARLAARHLRPIDEDGECEDGPDAE
jgi:hypothetical protein